MTILDEIVGRVRSDLVLAKTAVSADTLYAQAESVPVRGGFADALRRPPGAPMRVIAELKKASPSRGIIRADFDPVSLACDLAEHGAAALSVLTERHYFQGSPDYLMAVVRNVNIPVLRKDFIVDRYQLYEARLWGASAVLLIIAALSSDEYVALLGEAKQLGLDVLTEVHNARELDVALEADADVIGVNSRNLKTFEIDLSVTENLLSRIPDGCVRVAESGVKTPSDIARFSNADACLVGETLMRGDLPGVALARLLSN